MKLTANVVLYKSVFKESMHPGFSSIYVMFKIPRISVCAKKNRKKRRKKMKQNFGRQEI
jgi:hypothetical protein